MEVLCEEQTAQERPSGRATATSHEGARVANRSKGTGKHSGFQVV